MAVGPLLGLAGDQGAFSLLSDITVEESTYDVKL
jgi:hypothetical protein